MKEANVDLGFSREGLAPKRAEVFPCDPKTVCAAEEKEDGADGAELSPPRTPKPEVAPVAPGAGIPNNPVEV